MNYLVAHISPKDFRDYGNQVPEEYGFGPVEADSVEEAVIKAYFEALDELDLVADATHDRQHIAISNPGPGKFHSEDTWELFSLKVDLKKLVGKRDEEVSVSEVSAAPAQEATGETRADSGGAGGAGRDT